MSVEVTDEMICRLTQEWAATLPTQYPEPKHPHHFSLRFYWKMRPILRQARENKGTQIPLRGRRLAAAFLAAALLTVTVAMAIPAIREKVFQMVREAYERYSRVYYEEAGEVYPAGEFVEYHLTYIPEGFVQIQDQNVGSSHIEQYKNADGLVIKFRQKQLEYADFDIDTEEDAPIEIWLNENQTAWYLENSTLKVLYWDDGEYSFKLFSHVSKEELVKIANFASDK